VDILASYLVWIAPSDNANMSALIQSQVRFRRMSHKNPLSEPHRPSVDVLFESVVRVWPGRLMAVVMTGMGADGARGVRAVKNRGGLVIAQDQDTCVVYGMPKAAYETGCVDRLVPLDEIPEQIMRFLDHED
jgi:chemotaxis response regulator CheB